MNGFWSAQWTRRRILACCRIHHAENLIAMIIRALALALLSSLAGGCATPPRIDRMNDGESVKVVITRAPSDGELSIRNASLGKNAGTGATGGGLAGGLWGLACGPFAIICVPLGAGIGALAGGTGGAVVGATASLSDGEAAQLRNRLSQAMVAHDLVEQLRTNVAERARRHWDLTSDSPSFQLNIELGNVELTSTRDEQIGLILRARASLQRISAPPKAAVVSQNFECSAPPSNLAIWLDERSDFLETVLSNCTQQLAAQLVAETTRR